MLDHNPQPLDDTIYTRRIILGTSVPVSTLFFIVVFISCLYARRFRAYQDRMAAAVHFQNTDNSIHLVLPSYDDALKSKPTTPPPLYSEEESSPMLQSPQGQSFHKVMCIQCEQNKTKNSVKSVFHLARYSREAFFSRYKTIVYKS